MILKKSVEVAGLLSLPWEILPAWTCREMAMKSVFCESESRNTYQPVPERHTSCGVGVSESSLTCPGSDSCFPFFFFFLRKLAFLGGRELRNPWWGRPTSSSPSQACSLTGWGWLWGWKPCAGDSGTWSCGSCAGCCPVWPAPSLMVLRIRSGGFHWPISATPWLLAAGSLPTVLQGRSYRSCNDWVLLYSGCSSWSRSWSSSEQPSTAGGQARGQFLSLLWPRRETLPSCSPLAFFSLFLGLPFQWLKWLPHFLPTFSLLAPSFHSPKVQWSSVPLGSATCLWGQPRLGPAGHTLISKLKGQVTFK